MFNDSFKSEKYYWNDTGILEQIKINVKDLENCTGEENVTFEKEYNDYIFDSLGIRILFIVLYSIVFCGCVFGI
ncbi:hypothetical protein Phum_PHUM447480 [Pediculus humanus corporis]|uniref:Uncharacterized protein n=1 Tax=Pediculus humanus subsp. corporis TaxID=121224 RepID=E0VU81_PEDHC|nr:uncharacterized protein Phum_PHUM447480 [Pediculus humanus corporis]EEB16937.1 hypothetical protein Phum_PHUM447480 [Pediculus humanus corporis]